MKRYSYFVKRHGGIEELRKQSYDYVAPNEYGKYDYLHTGGARPTVNRFIKYYILMKNAEQAAEYLSDSSVIKVTQSESEALTYAFIRFIEENMEQ